LEPWFHGISIIIPLVCGLIFIAMKAFNEDEGVCFIVPNDDGRENPILYLVTAIVGYGSGLIITPTVIAGTMLLMYRSVSKIEKNMRNYGVNALRLNARSGGGNRGDTAGTTNTRSLNDQGRD
jgi:hypothetical protein